MTLATSRLAPAKINLYLHVAAPDANGYHPLQSLVVFADIGDRLSLREQPGLTITGPFASGLSTGEDNLILKAQRLFEVATGIRYKGGFILDKQLPLASGLGGGSADAGACLHLLHEACAPDLSDADLNAIASSIGADGPMCLWNQSSIAESYGEKLTSVPLPSMQAVLINPGIDCSTGQVYHMLDQGKHFENIDVKSMFQRTYNLANLVAALQQTRNDLQAPAIAIQPVIADILAKLDAQPQTLLARMSGSGATCFALCASNEDAAALALGMQGVWPAHWVRACRLG